LDPWESVIDLRWGKQSSYCQIL